MPRFTFKREQQVGAFTKRTYKADRRYKQSVQAQEILNYVNELKEEYPNRRIQLTIHSDLNRFRNTYLKPTNEQLSWTSNYGDNFFADEFGKITFFYINIL